MNLVTHPLMSQRPQNFVFSHETGSRLRASGATSMGAGMSGGFDFVNDFVDSFADVISSIVQTVANVVALILKVIGDVVQGLHIDQLMQGVFDTGKSIGKWIADKYVKFNAVRLWADAFRTNYYTAHAFNELNKFTGGFVTNYVNTSDLVYRVARGDKISKIEYIRDAMFGIQVAALAFGGPAAVGGLMGNWVGNVACRDLKDVKARNVCRGVFIVAGAASGKWYDEQAFMQEFYNADTSMYDTADLDQAFSESGLIDVTDLATEGGMPPGLLDYVGSATGQYLSSKGIDEVTREAVQMCNQGNWVSDDACRILGQIASDYAKAPEGVEWTQFLAEEIAKIGIQELAAQWFPVKSREHAVIYNTIPGVELIPVPEAQSTGFDLRGLLLLAGGAAFIIFAGSV